MAVPTIFHVVPKYALALLCFTEHLAQRPPTKYCGGLSTFMSVW